MPFHRWKDIPKDYHGAYCDVKVVTGDRLQLCLAEIWTPGEYVMHHHPPEQFGYLLRGQLQMVVGDEEKMIGPGDLWHAPPDVIHGGKIIGDESIVFLDIFTPARDDLQNPEENYLKPAKPLPRKSWHI